ncbi:MAG: hypothetical protein H6742_07910 [Alphaproteobacteria bacterium]|nr:hypothetical protein [Alphaproteobacteria bacterium]
MAHPDPDDVPAVPELPPGMAAQLPAPPREALALGGPLTLPEGRGIPWLIRHDGGGWLALYDPDAAGTTLVDLATLAGRARWNARLVGDRLQLDDQAASVPIGAGRGARRLVARARVAAWAGIGHRPDREVAPSPWCEPSGGALDAWLAQGLDPDDAVIALLPTATTAPLDDPWQPEAVAAWHWVLTRRRHLLVAVSELGAVVEAELPDATVVVDGTGRCRSGERAFRLPRSRLAVARRIAGLAGLTGAARVREAARRLARDGDAQGRRQAAALIEGLGDEGDLLDPLRRAVVEGVLPDAAGALPEPLSTQVAALPERGLPAAAMVMWEEAWPVSPALTDAIIATTRARDAAWALSLHAAVHTRREMSRERDRVDPQADLALAEHMLEVGESDGVAGLLTRHLPEDRARDEAEALLAPTDVDQRTRAILWALARAAVLEASDPAPWLAALARRSPLARESHEALADHDGPLRAAAARAVAVLDGQLRAPQRETPDGLAALEDATLDDAALDRCRYPAGRDQSVTRRLAEALAKVDPPDAGALRDYCERLDRDRYPQASRALTDAALLLGMPAVPAFVSRGERRVGVRAHADPEPFLVIGHDHLADGDARMDPRELAFAVGSELAHLRFGHARATSGDVWAGLWDKGGTALSVTGALVPLLDVFAVGGRLARAGRVGATAAGALGSLSGLTGRGGDDEPSTVRGLATDEARLLAVHRTLQLSADRVGLLLAGDPGAAVRAMMLMHPRLHGELAVAERTGLAAALDRRGPDGQLLLPHLALRVAALLAFWIDPERLDLVRRASPAPREQAEGAKVPC